MTNVQNLSFPATLQQVAHDPLWFVVCLFVLDLGVMKVLMAVLF